MHRPFAGRRCLPFTSPASVIATSRTGFQRFSGASGGRDDHAVRVRWLTLPELPAYQAAAANLTINRRNLPANFCQSRFVAGASSQVHRPAFAGVTQQQYSHIHMVERHHIRNTPLPSACLSNSL